MKKKNLLQRAIIITVVTLFGLYIVIGPRHRPTLKDFTWSGIKATLASNIRLGLDLKGGSHLVMRVKTEEFLKHLTEANAVAAQGAAKDAGFAVANSRGVTTRGNYLVRLETNDPASTKHITGAIPKEAGLGASPEWREFASGRHPVWCR